MSNGTERGSGGKRVMVTEDDYGKLPEIERKKVVHLKNLTGRVESLELVLPGVLEEVFLLQSRINDGTEKGNRKATVKSRVTVTRTWWPMRMSLALVFLRMNRTATWRNRMVAMMVMNPS